jgi:hypothetical protein
MAFESSADLDVYFTDFGVPVVYGATNARGILRIYDQGNPSPNENDSTIGRFVEVLVKTGALPQLSLQSIITVDGIVYTITSFDRVNDGAFTKIECQGSALGVITDGSAPLFS